jgi:putative colanic acid biosynthesis glycosyltransferase WcaI
VRVLFLTHFFPPEVGAPQLRARCHDVRVLTNFPHYPSGVVPAPYRGRWLMREEVGGVPVLRSWVLPARNAGFLRRVLDHLSFSASALPAASRLGWRPDVISVDMHPVFLCATAYALSRAWRVPYVINAGDLIPEMAVEIGALRNPLAIRLTAALSRFVCRHAALIVPFTRGIGEMLVERGVAPSRVELIHYGASTAIYGEPERWQPLPASIAGDLEGRFVVTYAGTHGLSQGLEVVLDAADRLRAEPAVRFLLVGDGADKPRLVAAARQRGLDNVSFSDPLPHAAMPSLYARSELCLVSLRKLDSMRRAGLPSKLFEIMAAGRPVVVAAEGEPAEIVDAADAGVTVPPGDGARLAEAIERLRRAPARRRRLGENGRRYIERHLTRERVTERYEQALLRAVGAA